MIQVSDLCKRYGNQEVLKNISFEVQKGETVGLLGPNGAGKSTLIKIISCFFAEKGLIIETDNISVELLSPPQSVKSALEIQNSEKVYLVQRIKKLEGQHICFMRNYLLAKYVPKLEKNIDELKKIGLYQLLERVYRVKIDRAVDTITTYLSGPLETEVLQLKENLALFRNMRTTYLVSGEAFENVISVIRGDVYEYKIYLQGRPRKHI